MTKLLADTIKWFMEKFDVKHRDEFWDGIAISDLQKGMNKQHDSFRSSITTRGYVLYSMQDLQFEAYYIYSKF